MFTAILRSSFTWNIYSPSEAGFSFLASELLILLLVVVIYVAMRCSFFSTFELDGRQTALHEEFF